MESSAASEYNAGMKLIDTSVFIAHAERIRMTFGGFPQCVSVFEFICFFT